MVKEVGLSYLRSKELLLRWMELSAVADVIFRSHQGQRTRRSSVDGKERNTGMAFYMCIQLSSSNTRELMVFYAHTESEQQKRANGFPRSLCCHALGNMPTKSWQVYSDNSTMRCFARQAALHALFVPLRKGLSGHTEKEKPSSGLAREKPSRRVARETATRW